MGTEVQLKGYSPGIFVMGDLNEDTKGVWTPFCEGTYNEHMYNGLMSKTVDSCSEYYKTLLRQTMLSHEEVFKKQVIELHRLYRVQRNMMHELKREEGRFWPAQVQSTRPTLFKNDAEKCQLRSCFRLINGNYGLAGISESEDAIKCFNGSPSRFSLVSRGSDYSKSDHLPHSRPTETSRKLFDLQLPADAYLDNDDLECSLDNYTVRVHLDSADRVSGNGGIDYDCDVDLTLGTTFCCDKLSERPCSSVKMPYAHKMADLNGTLEKSGDVVVPCLGFPLQMVHPGRLEEHQKESVESFSFSLGFSTALHSRGYNSVNEFAFPCNSNPGKTSNFLGSLDSTSFKEAHQSSESFLLSPRGIHHTLSQGLSPNHHKPESRLPTEKPPRQTDDSSDLSSNTATASPGITGSYSSAINLASIREFTSIPNARMNAENQFLSIDPLYRKPESTPSHEMPSGVDLNLAPPNGNDPVFEFHRNSRSGQTQSNPEADGKNPDPFVPPASIKGNSTRFVSEIDLEAPITSLPDDRLPSAVMADAAASAAAQAIQMMSQAKHHLPSSKNYAADSGGFLLLLADVILSSLPGDVDELSGMDYFECKALELKETDLGALHCCCGQAEEEEASLNRPRKAAAKRRRQHRNFQKEILPGLASLSRHEVTEDLQLIGGLVRTSNQALCRRRPRPAAVAAAAAAAPPGPPLPCTAAKSRDGVVGVMSWGRTTRRGRRQRCQPSTAIVLPVV
ncbi:uncharacterized protein LOC144702180 [Wolffia australiana]